MKRNIFLWAFCCLFASLAPLAAQTVEPDAPTKAQAAAGTYEAVQDIFNSRCILCHSCSNTPCQLKLTSFEGLLRGGTKIEAIHPTRLQSIPPTRLGIDARSASEWRHRGFFPVAEGETNLIAPMLNQGATGRPSDAVADSHVCPANAKDVEEFRTSHPEKLMPYGLPALSQPERDVLVSWANSGQRRPITKEKR